MVPKGIYERESEAREIKAIEDACLSMTRLTGDIWSWDRKEGQIVRRDAEGRTKPISGLRKSNTDLTIFLQGVIVGFEEGVVIGSGGGVGVDRPY